MCRKMSPGFSWIISFLTYQSDFKYQPEKILMTLLLTWNKVRHSFVANWYSFFDCLALT